MRQYTAENLVIHPGSSLDLDVVAEVTPESAGWNTINFQVRRLPAGRAWPFQTHGHELALVMLGGTVDVDSNRGQWQGVGRRAHVFEGLPYALYLPPRTTLKVTAQTDAEFAVAWVAVDPKPAPGLGSASGQAILVTPSDVGIEIRGGDHATRQINQMLPPGFPCQRLVVVEVYTPAGNWSSYPPTSTMSTQSAPKAICSRPTWTRSTITRSIAPRATPCSASTPTQTRRCSAPVSPSTRPSSPATTTWC